jgi:hypothetical protein
MADSDSPYYRPEVKTSTPLSLFQKLASSGDTTGWSEFISNPKGFFQDVSKVSQYDPTLGAQATSNPSAYYSAYDQFLKGTNQGSAPGANGGTYQYEGDSSYYRPIVSPGLGMWYDYNNNAFKNLGDGFGSGSTPSTPVDPGSTPPVDTPAGPLRPRPKGEEYQYGSKNPYMGKILGLGTKVSQSKKGQENYLEKLLGRT